MKILIIDDQQAKAEKLAKLIGGFGTSIEILHASNAHDGFSFLASGDINLVLLDVVLPLSFGEEPSEAGSLWFVRETHRKLSGPCLPLIVGTTQYAESLIRVQEVFHDYLWSIVHISDQEDRWPRQIQHAVRFAQSNAPKLRLSGNNDRLEIDAAIVTALRLPEFDELVDVLGGGDPLHLDETNQSWLQCNMTTLNGQNVKILAACADDMGMTAMSSLVTQVSIACKPKVLILVGIMGGNIKHVGLSDLIVIEETWDCRAGKITEEGFSADVKSRTCSFKLANKFLSVVSDEFLLNYWKNWKGERPDRIPRLHKGPVACSPAVIADSKIFTELEDQKRKIFGVEMEAFGCYDAVRRLGDVAPDVVCIKSVCDLGDRAKNDKYHKFCASLSAAAAVNILKHV